MAMQCAKHPNCRCAEIAKPLWRAVFHALTGSAALPDPLADGHGGRVTTPEQ
ncbi:MAG: hypothetical protein LBD30_06645 [Verrucomicrobiales bacterium]|nr:hypothetical protein [Verrucomicrobiales bacterium]